MVLLTRLHRLSLGHPILTLLVAGAAVFAVATGTPKLRLRTDGAALVPSGHPAVLEDQRIRADFGLTDPLVIVIPAPEGQSIFNPDTLRRVIAWTGRLETLNGIKPTDVFSLASERGDRVFPGTLRFRTLLDPVPETPREIEALRDYLRAIRLFHGTLIAEDESATAIMVSVPRDADRTEFTRTVQTALEEFGPLPDNVTFVGAPVAESLLGTHLLEDLGLPEWLIRRQGGLALREAERPSDHGDARNPLASLRRVGLVPLAMLVIGTVILIAFGSPLVCLLAMLKVGACLMVVLGLMGWTGSPVYLPTAVMPVILTVAAITEEIHLFSRYRFLLRTSSDDSRCDALRRMLGEVHVPMVKTAITTAIGFLAFAAAPIGPVRGFGLWTAVGILFSMGWSLAVTPAWLELLSPRWLFPFRSTSARPQAMSPSPSPSPLFRLMGRACVRTRYAVLAVVLLLILFAPRDIRRIIVQDSWIDGFAPDSRFARAATSFNGHFLGMHQLHVAVETHRLPVVLHLPPASAEGNRLRIPRDDLPADLDLSGWRLTLRCAGAADSPPASALAATARVQTREQTEDAVYLNLDRTVAHLPWRSCPAPEQGLRAVLEEQPLLQPAMLSELDRFETFLAEQSDLAVGGVLGPATYVKTTAFIIWGKKETARVIPDQPERIAWVWQQYAATRGEARLRQVVDPGFQRAVVTIYLKNANFRDTANLIARIREYEEETWKPRGATLTLAGDVAVSQAMIAAVVSTPVRSVIASLIGILFVATLVGRSLRIGLLCAFPSTLAVLLIFAFMGRFAVPLGVATSMFAAMTLGIGDDFAIHLVEHFRRARAAGRSRADSAVDAVAHLGPTLTIDALALALGFAVLMVSQVPANARLGMLLVLSLGVCLVASLLILPALMTLISPSRNASTRHVD